MYFPDGTTFQNFFFDTYIGYFLQALPIAFVVSAVYGFVRFRKDKETHIGRKLFSCLFVCYITGLMTSGFPPFVRSFDGRTANIKRASAFR